MPMTMTTLLGEAEAVYTNDGEAAGREDLVADRRC